MSLTRRDLLKGTGAFLASTAWGSPGSATPHYMVFICLRGGLDSVMSLNAQDPSYVKNNVHLGYRAEERVRGTKRLFGPLIGDLVRHDDDLALIHGVRSDTTAHPNGIAMLERGSIRVREGRFVDKAADALPGDAPLKTLELSSFDGELRLRASSQPTWSELRADVHESQWDALGAKDSIVQSLSASTRATRETTRFLDEAARDADGLDAKFRSPLGGHLRTAFQAIRGDWARVVDIATRDSWFDSHSDNDRFQRERQPGMLSDIASFVDLLKAERTPQGCLLDQTTIVVFSEFGRFPRLNGEGGKDHWPENTWALIGRGVRRGVTIGATDPLGKGQPIDCRTGNVRADGGRPIFLDNAFASLYRITGADPVDVGYEPNSEIEALLRV